MRFAGNIFIQTNLGTEIFDYVNNVEYPLANIPHAVRTYPGSAATAMLPLTPANNYTATIMFVRLQFHLILSRRNAVA